MRVQSLDPPAPRAFVVCTADTVATLLEDAPEGARIHLIGEIGSTLEFVARQAIPAAHKVALCAMKAGESIIKYNHRIGRATQPIAVGEWVHLHNCASDLDERSNTLDLHTGAPSDTQAAYE